jgi:hypothetical protein
LEAEIRLVVYDAHVRNRDDNDLRATHPERFHGRDAGRATCG